MGEEDFLILIGTDNPTTEYRAKASSFIQASHVFSTTEEKENC